MVLDTLPKDNCSAADPGALFGGVNSVLGKRCRTATRNNHLETS
jgi:hypothetical protein